MHLVPLLSAILALCSAAQFAVGLPHPQEQEQRQQPEVYSFGDRVRDALTAIGVAGGTFAAWKLNQNYQQKLHDLGEGQKDTQRQVSLGSVRAPILSEN